MVLNAVIIDLYGSWLDDS